MGYIWKNSCKFLKVFACLITQIALSYQGVFDNLSFFSMQAGSENFDLLSRLASKWHFSWLAFMRFSWNHLKSLKNVFRNIFLVQIVFFVHYKGCYYQHNWEYLKVSIMKKISHKNILNKIENTEFSERGQ